jgi:16S rRNA (uracil1498-N3)-methyltransferase
MVPIMAIPRFYCEPPLADHPHFTLPAAVAHHAVRVLRLRVGHDIILFDGTGGEQRACITEINGGEVGVQRVARSEREAESTLQVWLGQALCVNEKMDLVFQKAVELGVVRLSPINTERSVVRLSIERAQKREQHWQRVVISACEQSGRNRVPTVDPLASLQEWLATLPTNSLKLILAPQAETSLDQLSPPTGPVVVLVGPEGGFSEGEMAAAQAAGFISLRLGPRILRTETAAMALLAALQGRWGDFVETVPAQPL